MEILWILWSKALLLVLQNLRPTHIGTLKLSPFELTARHPSSSHLFHSQLIKGDILQGCKGLITLTENNHASVEQFFSKTSNTTLCNLEISLLRKTSPKKNPLFNHAGEALIKCYGPIPVPPSSKESGSWIHVCRLKKASNPYWMCTPTGNLALKSSRNWSTHRTAEGDGFPQMTRPDLYTFSCCGFLPYSPSLSWKGNAPVHISQSTGKGESLSNCWICHQKLQSVH